MSFPIYYKFVQNLSRLRTVIKHGEQPSYYDYTNPRHWWWYEQRFKERQDIVNEDICVNP